MLRRALQSCCQHLKANIAAPVARSASSASKCGSSSLVDLREGKYNSYDSHSDVYKAYNEKSPVWACNEWDPLEEVIIGRPDHAVVPVLRAEVKACLDPSKWSFYEQHGGKYWADVAPEHWKKLVAEVDNFVKVMESYGVKVVRPDEFDFGREFKTPYFTTKGFYCAMPRDILIVVADEIIEGTLTWRQRYFEFYAYRSLIKDYWRRGAKWTQMPKPACDDQLIDEKYDEDGGRHRRGETVLSESEPVLEAADVIRAGTDLFAQPSQVTNRAGIEWLRRHLAPRGIRVHEVRFRDSRPMHIDCTFSLVKPGYVLCNPDRPLLNPEHFLKAGWKLVDVPQPNVDASIPYWLSSKWLAMNTFMLDTEHVFVEKSQTGYFKMFEKMGVKPIPVPIQHMNSIGGGFHCWTCDTRRRGKMENYF